MADVTQILSSIEAGDPHASEELLLLVYDELRSLAAAKLAHEKPGQTLQATALVHEAYLKLTQGKDAPHWNDQMHFCRAAAEAMRRILVDNARSKNSLKRGKHLQRIDIEHIEANSAPLLEDAVTISEALDRFAIHDGEKAELVKLRYFGGLSLQEAATALGISRATANRHWGYAKTWLYCELSRDAPNDQH